MIASIFNQALGEKHVLATTGNLNNEIGLPLTLLELRDDHQLAVVELGMNHPGETKVLADLAVANIALINNAQREHQEFMTSVEMVAKEHALAVARDYVHEQKHEELPVLPAVDWSPATHDDWLVWRT